MPENKNARDPRPYHCDIAGHVALTAVSVYFSAVWLNQAFAGCGVIFLILVWLWRRWDLRRRPPHADASDTERPS